LRLTNGDDRLVKSKKIDRPIRIDINAAIQFGMPEDLNFERILVSDSVAFVRVRLRTGGDLRGLASDWSLRGYPSQRTQGEYNNNYMNPHCFITTNGTGKPAA